MNINSLKTCKKKADIDSHEVVHISVRCRYMSNYMPTPHPEGYGKIHGCLSFVGKENRIEQEQGGPLLAINGRIYNPYKRPYYNGSLGLFSPLFLWSYGFNLQKYTTGSGAKNLKKTSMKLLFFFRESLSSTTSSVIFRILRSQKPATAT